MCLCLTIQCLILTICIRKVVYLPTSEFITVYVATNTSGNKTVIHESIENEHLSSAKESVKAITSECGLFWNCSCIYWVKKS